MNISIDNSWTLFLDRDGVINHRIPGQYISDPKDLKLTEGCAQAIASFNLIFARVVVVTNQAGIGKEIMTNDDLNAVHDYITKRIALYGARLDKYYHCPEKPDPNNLCRKPAPGMALQAKNDFPEIDFAKSIMVGDSLSDINFGKQLGMKTVLVKGKEEEEPELLSIACDLRVDDLYAFAQWINQDQLID